MSTIEDPWASRVALILDDELPKPTQVGDVRPLSIRQTRAMQTRLRAIDRARVTSALRRQQPMFRPLFIESSYVEEPALSYRQLDLVTKEEGLPRQLVFKGRVYVKSDASLAMSEPEWSRLLERSAGLLDVTPPTETAVLGDWPPNISVAGESFTLYREGQYDLIGLWFNEYSETFEGKPELRFASVCSLCNTTVYSIFKVNEKELRNKKALDIMRDYLDDLRITECPNCNNSGTVS